MADLADWIALKERAEDMLLWITPEEESEILPRLLGGYMGSGAAMAAVSRTRDAADVLYKHVESLIDRAETLRMERENGIT